MFELRSKMNWYFNPLESDLIVQRPSLLEFCGPLTPPPPTPLEFPIPSVVGVWIFSGTTQLLELYRWIDSILQIHFVVRI